MYMYTCMYNVHIHILISTCILHAHCIYVVYMYCKAIYAGKCKYTCTCTGLYGSGQFFANLC